MKYYIKSPAVADGYIVEKDNVVKAIIEALNNCNEKDFWKMSTDCKDSDGMYIDAYPGFLDEDEEEVWFNVAFIVTVRDGDNYTIKFTFANSSTYHTIRRIDEEEDEIAIWQINGLDKFDCNGNKL